MMASWRTVARPFLACWSASTSSSFSSAETVSCRNRARHKIAYVDLKGTLVMMSDAQVDGSPVYFRCRNVANYSHILPGLFAAKYTNVVRGQQCP